MIRAKSFWFCAVGVLTCFLLVAHAEAGSVELEGDTISSAEILTESINFSCIAWQPIGVCLWMTCTTFGCDFDYSLKVRHNISDAVVSAYPDTGENPWTDVKAYSQPTSLAEAGGSNSEGSTVITETALRFKNGDAIGSPGNLYFEALSSSDFFCDPGATVFWPYLLSTIDPNWRDPVVETPWTLNNALRGLRTESGTSYFGPIYPRIGFVNQGHDYKSAAVNAQRVADITTRSWQPHIYWPMVWDRAAGYWPPGSVKEGDETTHTWQQLVPKGNSSTCAIFPDIDDGTNLDDPYAERLSERTGYAWNLWRPYRCCEREGAVLIFHTGE